MAYGKRPTVAGVIENQAVQRAALALPGEPLRGQDDGTAREPVSGLVSKRPPGRGSEVSPSERRTIILAKLTGPTISQEELARRFGRSRDTIQRILASPEYEQLKSELDATTAAEARGVLASGRMPAVNAWLASLEKAAQRGDHRPSRDLLLHTDVISPISQQGSGPQVIVNVGQVINAALPRCGLPESVPIIDAMATTESEHDDDE